MSPVKKAQQVGTKVKELQEELTQTEIEAVAADGGVTVVISGAQVPISVEVTDELLAKGADAVSEAVGLAAAQAHSNSMEYAKDRMSELCTPARVKLHRRCAGLRCLATQFLLTGTSSRPVCPCRLRDRSTHAAAAVSSTTTRRLAAPQVQLHSFTAVWCA